MTTNMYDKTVVKYKMIATLSKKRQRYKIKEKIDSFLFFKNLNKAKLIIITLKCVCELSFFTIVTKFLKISYEIFYDA